jgi:hypothetical protein
MAQRELIFMQATRPSVVCDAMPQWYLLGVTP